MEEMELRIVDRVRWDVFVMRSPISWLNFWIFGFHMSMVFDGHELKQQWIYFTWKKKQFAFGLCDYAAVCLKFAFKYAVARWVASGFSVRQPNSAGVVVLW